MPIWFICLCIGLGTDFYFIFDKKSPWQLWKKRPCFFASQSSIWSWENFVSFETERVYKVWTFWEAHKNLRIFFKFCVFLRKSKLSIKNCCLTFCQTEQIHKMTTISTQNRQSFSLRTILIENSGHFVNLLSFRIGHTMVIFVTAWLKIL